MVSNEDVSALYTELGRDDVLLGRGTGPNEHIGNVRFRAIAMKTLLELELSSGHLVPERFTATMKTKLAKKLCEEVRARGGKFVKKVELYTTGGNKTKGAQGSYYQEVPLKVALDKAKQSFRHQLRVNSRTAISESSLREVLTRKTEITRCTKDKTMKQAMTTTPVAAPEDDAAALTAGKIPTPLAGYACEAMRPAVVTEAVQKLNSSRDIEDCKAQQRNRMSHLIPVMYHYPATIATRTETIDQQLNPLSLADTNLLGLITSLAARKLESPHDHTMADRHARCLPHLLSIDEEPNRQLFQISDIKTLPTWASTNYSNSFAHDIGLVQTMLLLNKESLPPPPSAADIILRGRPITISDIEKRLQLLQTWS